MKTGQIFLKNKFKLIKTVGSLGYLYRMDQLWVSEMMLNVHSKFNKKNDLNINKIFLIWLQLLLTY